MLAQINIVTFLGKDVECVSEKKKKTTTTTTNKQKTHTQPDGVVFTCTGEQINAVLKVGISYIPD